MDKRLKEIEKRLKVVQEYDDAVPLAVLETVEEAMEIVEFWKQHLDEAVEPKLKKEHKTFNLWTDDPI